MRDARSARGRAIGRGIGLLSAMLGAVGLVIVGSATGEAGQPPLAQMSGVPLPDPALPDGTVTVRVVRGAVTNNVAGQSVELRQGDTVLTAVTDDEGRATFTTLSAGARTQATTVLDSQLLQSQSCSAPRRGGVRVNLGGADAGEVAVPVQPGTVSFGEESWIQIELVEESIEAYFFLDIVNPSPAPVQPVQPVVVDMPSGAQGTTILRSSSPRAVADGPRVEIAGPFPPGSTPLHFAYILPYSGDRLVLDQRLPLDLDSLILSVEKWGDVDFVSSQVQRRMEIPAEAPNASPYVVGGGPRIPAGQPLAVELVGLPHHDSLASMVAVVLAVGILVVGLGAGIGSPAEGDGRRRTLEARRARLFADLVKVERQHRDGKIGTTKHASRREELLRALETVYRELDDQLTATWVDASPMSPPVPASSASRRE